MRILYLSLISLSLFVTTGCVIQHDNLSYKAGRKLEVLEHEKASDFADAAMSHGPEEPDGDLALNEALSLVLLNSPDLASYSHGLRAAEADMLQSRVLPNPELEFEVENLDRDGAGYDYAEPSVKLGQLIEMGGKRSSRIDKSRAERDLACFEYESKRLDVLAETTQRFVGLICAQQRLELTGSLLNVAEQTFQAVELRVKSGKESPVQRTKALAELEMARLEHVDAQSALRFRRYNLSAMWGSDNPQFKSVVGSIDELQNQLPSLDSLRVQLMSNPLIAFADAKVRVHEAELSAAKAERVPDVTVMAGLKHFEEDDTDAVIVGAGFPLPLFDQNKGGISSAGHKLERARTEKRSAMIELATDLAKAYADFSSAHKRVFVLQKNVVPAMESSFNAAHSGYNEGKFELLDVLDAQRNLFRSKDQLIEAMLEYHTAASTIEKLTGKSLSEFIEEKK